MEMNIFLNFLFQNEKQLATHTHTQKYSDVLTSNKMFGKMELSTLLNKHIEHKYIAMSFHLWVQSLD